jgi:hypothetical protein
MSNVIYIFINKQLISFQNASAFYHSFTREGVERRSLVSHVCTENVALCCVTHVARELLVERVCSGIAVSAALLRIMLSE